MTILDDVQKYFNVTNLYAVLRVPNNSYQLEIKKAYLQRSLELHPDKTNDCTKKEEANRKFQILSDVYKILSNQESRSKYDQQISQNYNTCLDSRVFDELTLNMCIEHKDYYSYNCRCSGLFILDKIQLNNSTQTNIYIVDCDSCSNSIKIIL